MQDSATPLPEIPPPRVATQVGEPELAFKGKDGRRYVDPLPWCSLLGQAGVSPEQHAADPEHEFRSVTTWLGYMPKDRLVKWSANMAAACAVEDRWVIDVFGPDIARWWFATAGERFRDMAGERGNVVHDVAEDIGDARERDRLMRMAIDDLLAGRPIAPSLLENAKVSAYVKGLQRFWQDHAGIVPIWVEVTVFSRRHDYAGTLDLIAWVPGRGIVLLDWKSSRYILAKFSMQFAAYRHADYGIVDGVRVPVPRVDSAAVVHIGAGEPDPVTGEYPGSYEVVEMDSRPELLEVIDACQAMAKWDHPSRIMSPWESTKGVADGAAVERPKFRWLTAAELHAEATDGADDPELLELCRPPRERVEAVWREWRAMFVAWAADRVRTIVELAATDPAAAAMANALGEWWKTNVGPMVVDTDEWFDQCEDKVQGIIDGLSLAEQRLELPFGPPHPGSAQHRRDDSLFAQFSDEQMEAVASGRIFFFDGEYRPAPKREAGRAPRPSGYVCARRGRSVDPGDIGKDRDPKVRELEDRLIEQLAAVPADLMEQLDEWHRRAGIPNLRHRTATMPQLLAVQGKLADLVELRRKRTDRVMRAYRDRFPESTPELLPTVLTLCGAPHLDLLTDEHVEVFEQVMEACGNLHVLLDPEAPGSEPVFESRVSADQLAERWGTKKDALAAARVAAQRVGLKPPRSTTDAAKLPVLVALLMSERAVECLTPRAECDEALNAA